MDAPYGFPILNTFVPHSGHTPWVAGLPFFITMALVSFISLDALHFRQYPVTTNPLTLIHSIACPNCTFGIASTQGSVME